MSTTIVRLIDAEYLKANTAIDPNVDADILMPFIDKTQRIIVEGALGTALYNSVLTAVDSGSISPAYQTLIRDYIQPALAEWTYYNSINHIWARTTNKSISTSNSDNSNPITSEDLKFIKEGIRDTAEYLEQRLIKFLKANTDVYTLYLTPGSEMDDVRPKNNSLFSGIYVKRRNIPNGDSDSYVYDAK